MHKAREQGYTPITPAPVELVVIELEGPGATGGADGGATAVATDPTAGGSGLAMGGTLVLDWRLPAGGS